MHFISKLLYFVICLLSVLCFLLFSALEAKELSVVCRPSTVIFSHFRLVLRNRWKEFGDRKTKMADLKSDVLIHYFLLLLCNCWTELTDATAFEWLRICLLSSATPEWNLTKPYRKKVLNVLYQVCFFFQSNKQK